MNWQKKALNELLQHQKEQKNVGAPNKVRGNGATNVKSYSGALYISNDRTVILYNNSTV